MKFSVFIVCSLLLFNNTQGVCNRKLDLMFVLDGSKGVTSSEFNNLKSLIKNFIDQKNASPRSSLQVGVIVLGPGEVMRLFPTSDINKVKRELDKVQHPASDECKLDVGINSAKLLLIYKYPRSTRKVMIVLTSKLPPDQERTVDALDSAKQEQIEVFQIALKLTGYIWWPKSNMRFLHTLPAAALPDIILDMDGVDCGMNGHVTTAICGRTCMNGGHCLADGLCLCANGFYGDACEYSATWIKDRYSGKQYTDLKTTVYSQEEATERCLAVGGILPEPRDYYENIFLNSMGTNTFFLGMTKRNGYWIWNSDGSRVRWTIWWPVKGWQYCAYMLRNTMPSRPDKMRWSSVDCWRHDLPRTTVCEKTHTDLQHNSRGWTFVPSLTALLGFCLVSHFL